MWKIIAFLLCCAAPLRAETPAQVDLLPGWRAGERHIAALRIRLAPGWKTYWRSPGDAGLPPVFDWSASQNIASAEPHWPVPKLLETSGMTVIGYEGEVIFPLTFELDGGGAPRLTGRVDIGLCKDVCVPHSVQFDALLPETSQPVPAIEAALRDGPRQGQGRLRCLPPEAGLIAVELGATVPPGAGLALEMQSALIGQPSQEPLPASRGTRISARLYAPAPIMRDAVRLTVIAPEGGAVEYLGCD